MDKLADLLANDPEGSVPRAGRALGLDGSTANEVMQRIRKGLGPQAR